MSRTPLESRLRDLAIEAPDDLAARARARARGPERQRRLTPALVAASCVLVTGEVTGATSSPAAAAAADVGQDQQQGEGK